VPGSYPRIFALVACLVALPARCHGLANDLFGIAARQVPNFSITLTHRFITYIRHEWLLYSLIIVLIGLLLYQRRSRKRLAHVRLRAEQAEQSLRLSEELLTATLAQSPAAVIVASAPDVRVRLINLAAQQFLGMSSEEAQAMVGHSILADEPRTKTFDTDGIAIDAQDLPLSRAITHGETTKDRPLRVQRGNAVRDITVSASPVRDASGRVVAGIVIFQDATATIEARRSQSRLFTDLADKTRRIERAEALLKATLDQAPLGIVLAEAGSFKTQILNQYARQYFALASADSPSPAENWNDSVIAHPAAKCLWNLQGEKVEIADWPLVRAMRSGEAVTTEEYIYIPSAGKKFHFLLSATPIRDSLGQVYAGLGLMQDVTPQRLEQQRRELLDARVREAERLESVAVLAAGVAHDFNNFLVAILGHTELAQSTIPATHTARVDLDGIRAAAEQARVLVSQMLALTGTSASLQKPIDVNAIMIEQLAMLDLSDNPKITTAMTTESGQMWVRADRAQLRQAISNLLSNAVESMQENGGHLVVTVDAEVLNARTRFAGSIIEGTVRDGNFVRLCVHDAGHGMDDATVRRAFEPFFSTRFVGRGLGLAVVRGVIKAHQGLLAVESAPGLGTNVTLYFPQLDPPP
jgi:signal transduction histidine kinase